MMAGDITRAARTLALLGQLDTAMMLASAGQASGFAAGTQAVGEVESMMTDHDPAEVTRAAATGRWLSLDDAAHAAIEALTAL